MTPTLSSITLLLLFTLSLSHPSILHTSTYSFMSKYSPPAAGLSYPQYITCQDHQANLTITVYNLTSKYKTKSTFIPKSTQFLASECSCAAQLVDYGYYTLFPFYKIVAECRDQNHQKYIVYTVLMYRSGDFQLVNDPAVAYGEDQKNCQFSGLKSTNYYSVSGVQSKIVYSLCIKQHNTTQSLYKIYRQNTKSPQVLSEKTIENATGLNNISIVDVLPGLGTNGIYTAYLSGRYGLILNGGNKSMQGVYSIPNGDVGYKVRKICWSSVLSILTKNHIYYVNVTFNQQTQLPVFATLAKTQKRQQLLVPKQCQFQTIGNISICSKYNINLNSTDLYYYLLKQNNQFVYGHHSFNDTGYMEVYPVEDLCGSAGFYFGTGRYQFYQAKDKVDILQIDNKDKNKNLLRIKSFENNQNYGNPFSFLTVSPSTLIISYISSTSLSLVSYSTSTSTATLLSQIQIQNFQLIPYSPSMHFTTHSLSPIIISLYEMSPTGITHFYVFSQNGTKVYEYQVPIYLDGLTFLNDGATINNNTFVGFSKIQTKALARITLSGGLNVDFRYPYEFQLGGWDEICKIGENQKILLFLERRDDGLRVRKGGFRNRNAVILDDVQDFKVYANYYVKCLQEGFMAYSLSDSKVVVFDQNLVEIGRIQNISFTDIQSTKNLILLQRNVETVVFSLKSFKILGEVQFLFTDILANTHTNGFLKKSTTQYYQFVESSQEQVFMNKLRKEEK